jgi:hypothetical protein
MNAILQTARKYGQVRSGFTELCVRVTEEAANRQLRRGGIEDLYEAWRDGSAFANQTERSLQVQLSKLRVFWDFGHEFGIQGNKVPDVGLNMFPTELRKRLKRGYI